jgi:hypothetical protein
MFNLALMYAKILTYEWALCRSQRKKFAAYFPLPILFNHMNDLIHFMRGADVEQLCNHRVNGIYRNPYCAGNSNLSFGIGF